MEKLNFYQQVYEIVKQIPFGKVTNYGHIALLLGKPRAARAVGYALTALKKDQEQHVPWQRVIAKDGRIPFRGDLLRASLQKKILISEGLVFDASEKIDLNKQGWFPE